MGQCMGRLLKVTYPHTATGASSGQRDQWGLSPICGQSRKGKRQDRQNQRVIGSSDVCLTARTHPPHRVRAPAQRKKYSVPAAIVVFSGQREQGAPSQRDEALWAAEKRKTGGEHSPHDVTHRRQRWPPPCRPRMGVGRAACGARAQRPARASWAGAPHPREGLHRAAGDTACVESEASRAHAWGGGGQGTGSTAWGACVVRGDPRTLRGK
jgi:hypothetical protein